MMNLPWLAHYVSSNLLRCCYAVLLFAVSAPASAANLRVLLLTSSTHASYQAFNVSFQQRFPDATVHIQSVSDAEPLAAVAQSDIIVALGFAATELAASQTRLPMLTVFVPKTDYLSFIKKLPQPDRAAKMSVIYINQPLTRQLDFISALLPKHHRIGMLYSPASQADIAPLSEMLNAKGKTFNSALVNSDDQLFGQMETLLGHSDVLLAQPDPLIYSINNVRNILLSTYRYGVPVIGFSLSYVNAGALAAIYSSPDQFAQQAVSLLQKSPLSQRVSVAQYPNAFSIAVNSMLARSLDLAIPTELEIRNRMLADERGRNE
jgi:putative tryptophan/tyrosine transport system substrate-binding protein